MATDSLRGWYDDASNVAIVLMVLIVAAILYGAVIARQLLVTIGLVAPVILLYLLWRLVLAAERAADAAELLAAEGMDDD